MITLTKECSECLKVQKRITCENCQKLELKMSHLENIEMEANTYIKAIKQLLFKIGKWKTLSICKDLGYIKRDWSEDKKVFKEVEDETT